MYYPDVALDILSEDGKYDAEKVIAVICTVMTVNRDVVELLEAKGISYEQIRALCSLSEHGVKHIDKESGYENERT